jgi:hypothetical protein
LLEGLNISVIPACWIVDSEAPAFASLFHLGNEVWGSSITPHTIPSAKNGTIGTITKDAKKIKKEEITHFQNGVVSQILSSASSWVATSPSQSYYS